MDGIKILVLPSANRHLNNLIDILYKNNYFSDYADAVKYVNDLIDSIERYLPILKPRTPHYRRRVYGQHTEFITIRKNKRTSYLVFFLKKESTYIITYIGNNHTDGQYIERL